MNTSRQQTVATDLVVADTFWSSLVGLMGRKSLKAGQGLWIPHCQSVHTFWMRFPIDVIFLDERNVIIHAIQCLKPFRVSRHVSRAIGVIELPEATIQSTQSTVGDQIEMV
ncbi:MAG: DUF192 domain-containing protein [Acidobacteriota bacterium]